MWSSSRGVLLWSSATIIHDVQANEYVCYGRTEMWSSEGGEREIRKTGEWVENEEEKNEGINAPESFAQNKRLSSSLSPFLF